jgi:hypothetical protein
VPLHRFVLFGMQNRTFCPCLAAMHGISSARVLGTDAARLASSTACV